MAACLSRCQVSMLYDLQLRSVFSHLHSIQSNTNWQPCDALPGASLQFGLLNKSPSSGNRRPTSARLPVCQT